MIAPSAVADTCTLRAARIMRRCDALATDSARPDGIYRSYLSPEHARSNRRVRRWMHEAGMRTWRDGMGSQWGSLPGRFDRKAVVVGSHVDTVPNAGRYDGTLGVLLGIETAGMLRSLGVTMRNSLHVVAFGDEEGSRFPATLMTSRFVAGHADPAWLDLRDADGITLADAMTRFGLDPALLQQNPTSPTERIEYYLEPHIEQGCTLETAGHAVGVVSGIAGAVRATITVDGQSGHAASAMATRRDAGAGAAEAALVLERYAVDHPELRVTVGRMAFHPGTVNVVPGRAEFSVDLRATDDRRLAQALTEVRGLMVETTHRRGLEMTYRADHHAGAIGFGGKVSETVEKQVATRNNSAATRTWSMPGHDAMVFAGDVDTGMLFVRSAGGHSHSPLESVDQHDVADALAVCVATVLNLCAEDEVELAS